MDIITSILIILGVGLVLGQLFEHYRLAAVAGEIVGGIVLGPAILGIVRPDAVLSSLSELSLFFIVLLIGIEMTTEVLSSSYRKALPFSFTSFMLPVVIMTAILYFLFRFTFAASVIVSVSIGVPSISIISVLVRNYGLVQKPGGIVVLSSVIISDLLAFLILSAFLSSRTVLPEVVLFAIFLILLFYLDYLLERNSEKVMKAFTRLRATEHGEKVIFGVIIFSGLLVSSFFQFIGMTYVLGAFFSGMVISDVIVGKELFGIITRTLNRMNESFFIPVFFTIAGIQAVIPTSDYFAVLGSLLLITGGLSALMSRKVAEKIELGTEPMTTVGLLGGRGAVGVVIAGLALLTGLINYDLYSVILFGTVILSCIFPLLIRGKREENSPDA
ncbi:MAG: cation:proton antiporter [Thermoplasmata archaeon]|uniref:Cation:proton antiporter n=1 Tax=Candidatus Sysuiplasma superficiale TaxID=2823368 RepID=A0A8J8CD73_9ARCH|nr:cation:proton antiporter [Candidatus Sysuiplasma superficiale]MBX8644214.1 cation:proton antiporter [Candidatus Sysuiplasma superficiale]